ncbi:MAG: ABC transporter permease subunit [Gammaproteobacteria bacterium]|nr:ABC transporter permease subunit [Gammaproteobacteria bacterium]
MVNVSRLYATLSVITLLLIWQFIATLLKIPELPPATTVFLQLKDAIGNGQLPYHLGMTLLRLIISFSLSMLIGIIIGIALGRHQVLDQLFDQWLLILLNIPALVTIILCYLWFGLTEVAAILAVVINKVPNVAVTIREGTRALDKNLLEMAQSYRFSHWKIYRFVIWPQLFPYLMAAARSGLALIWKIILVVELLGCSNGMGYQLHLFFQLFDVTSILAYTIAFIVVIQLIELLILKPLEVRANRWR